MAPKDIVCFQCGQAVGEPPALNRLEGGESCPACRDRLLESLPAPFPSTSPVSEPTSGASVVEAVPSVAQPQDVSPDEPA